MEVVKEQQSKKEKKEEEMEEMRVRVIMVIVAIAWARVAMGEKLHKVGNSKGWNPNLNYTLWSSSHRFYLGDWLCKFLISFVFSISFFF